MAARALGWRPDPPKLSGQTPDFDAAAVLGDEEPPAEASAREHVLSIFDQGSLGTCVAQASEQAVRADLHRQGVASPGVGARLWGYYHARAKTHREAFDEGTFIRDYFERRAKLGCPPESAWPHRFDRIDGVERWACMPSPEAFRLAFDTRSPLAYRRIYGMGQERVGQIKRAIARERLVVFGAMVSERFCANDFNPQGLAPVPSFTDPAAGGHAMCLAAYDEEGSSGPNSWGTDFGLDGWMKFDWDYLGGPLCSDFWIVEQAPRLPRS